MKSIKIGYQHDMIQYYKTIKKGCSNQPYHFVVEGLWSHEKIIQTTTIIEVLYYCETLIRDKRELSILEKTKRIATNLYEISEKTMARLNSKGEPSCMVSICYKKQTFNNLRKVIVLDGLENPGNIGTIFRTCDGAGIDAVLVVNQKAKINQYKVIKASMGGCFNIPWKCFDTIEACQTFLNKHEFSLLLAHPGTESVRSHKESKEALVVGNERYGLSKEWFKMKHQTMSIPMTGCCDSLNVGVAASILIYQIKE
ncbi:MAG: RNA methyltransferase [Clostridiales bacterium]|nr:RNA methyltransferase [Clostridiales bacterium]